MPRIIATNHLFFCPTTRVAYSLPARAIPLIDALRARPQGALFRDIHVPGAAAGWYPLIGDLEALGVITTSHQTVLGRRSLWLQLDAVFAAAIPAAEVRLVGRPKA